MELSSAVRTSIVIGVMLWAAVPGGAAECGKTQPAPLPAPTALATVAPPGKLADAKVYYGRVGDVAPLVEALGADCAASAAQRLSLDEGWGFSGADGQLISGLRVSLWEVKGKPRPQDYYGHVAKANLCTIDGSDLLAVESGVLAWTLNVALYAVSDGGPASLLAEIDPAKLRGHLKELAEQLRARGVVKVRDFGAGFEPDGELHVRADARDARDQKVAVAVPAPSAEERVELRYGRRSFFLAHLCDVPLVPDRRDGHWRYFAIAPGRCRILVTLRPLEFFRMLPHEEIADPDSQHSDGSRAYMPLREITFEGLAGHKDEVQRYGVGFTNGVSVPAGLGVWDRTTKECVV
jgi:hypothetical protein